MFSKKNIFIFGKAQVSAFVGGLCDYGIMVFCVELLTFSVKNAIIVGGLIGAVINFSINKYWTYQSQKPSLSSQLVKFYIVVAGSILLKSNGTVLFTALLHLDYKITRIIVDLFVSIGFNFMLQKYWVFKSTPMLDGIDYISKTELETPKILSPNREYQEA
ncbi:MAG TPA: GtrA family protein [Chitinophagales bacterium]|nr:GtrA family protein [Chitinophagales bacterium]